MEAPSHTNSRGPVVHFWNSNRKQNTLLRTRKKCGANRQLPTPPNEFSSTSGVQVKTPLPALRVEQSAPLSVVGIDFGGPLYTKDENKHYIVLFTCAVTRALYLERASEQPYN
ncbi:hypothetical protein TNCV_3135101 [Trichonephila clavipes]|nr:hypothetical protein TNCV_3135101 [Trichonephila clavipes]